MQLPDSVARLEVAKHAWPWFEAVACGRTTRIVLGNGSANRFYADRLIGWLYEVLSHAFKPN